MDTTLQEFTLKELNQKIDLLTVQVAYLSEQAQLVERQRLERAELVRDITPLANQAFNLAVEQLEEVQEYVDLNDLLRFIKRLLCNGRNLEKILDQLESLADLVDTLSPLADEALGKAVDLTASLEAKGYFSFAKSSLNLMDKVVASLTPQELDQLGDNLGAVLELVKEISQPGIVSIAKHALAELTVELEKPVDGSYVGLVRQLRDPVVRRGLALSLRILQVIGSQAPKRQSNKNK